MVLITSFGLGSGVTIVALLPFFVLSFFVLVFTGAGIFVGTLYLRGKGFAQNSTLGTIIVVLSLAYFAYSLFSVALSYSVGNGGAWLQPIIALFWTLVSLPFGLAIRNGCK